MEHDCNSIYQGSSTYHGSSIYYLSISNSSWVSSKSVIYHLSLIIITHTCLRIICINELRASFIYIELINILQHTSTHTNTGQHPSASHHTQVLVHIVTEEQHTLLGQHTQGSARQHLHTPSILET